MKPTFAILVAVIFFTSAARGEILLTSISGSFEGVVGDTDRVDTSDSFIFALDPGITLFEARAVDWTDPTPFAMSNNSVPLTIPRDHGIWEIDLPWSPQGFYTPKSIDVAVADSWSDGIHPALTNTTIDGKTSVNVDTHVVPGESVTFTSAILEIVDFHALVLPGEEFSEYDIAFTIHLYGETIVVPEPTAIILATLLLSMYHLRCRR